MTRALSLSATVNSTASSSSPYYLARLDIGGSVGTLWFADRSFQNGDGSSWDDAKGCVSQWGVISARLGEDQRYTPVGDTTIEVYDDDAGTIHGWLQAVEFQNKRVRIYLSFLGLVASDHVCIFDGIINDSTAWKDDNRTLSIAMTDASTRFNKTIGNMADRATFPAMGEWDEDKMLPIVFGKQKRTACIAANIGAVTTLSRRCGWADTVLFVDNAEQFPQNTAISIRINNEIIEGSFTGNTFNVTQRYADLVTNYTVDSAVDNLSFDDLSLSSNSGTYVGYWVYVADPTIFGGYAYRRIWAYDGVKHRVFYQFPPFIIGDAEAILQPGRVYSITSRSFFLNQAHASGSDVYLVQTGYVYIVADHPVKSVDTVYAYGGVRQTTGESDQLYTVDREGYAQLEHDWYTVNTFDTTSFPSLGRPITTITFSKMPRELLSALQDNRIWADVHGAESHGDGTGTTLENPSDIIKALLMRSRWGNVTVAAINAASFASAATDLAYLPMAFTLTEQRELLDLVSDLAWQARSSLVWQDGVANLKVLYNNAAASAMTLDDATFALGTIQKQFTSLRDLTSEINAQYVDKLESKRVSVRDSGVETAEGRRTASRAFWAYRTENAVINAATFWLNRMKRIYEIVRLSAFLDAVKLERADTVTLDHSALFMAGQTGFVIGIDHSPGGGEGGIPPSVDITLRLPIAAGCLTTCEANCETGGCESGCEFACEAGTESCWRCETTCEDLCQLTCTTTTQVWCATYDVGCGEAGPCGALETCGGTETCSSCQTGGCESGCVGLETCSPIETCSTCEVVGTETAFDDCPSGQYYQYEYRLFNSLDCSGPYIVPSSHPQCMCWDYLQGYSLDICLNVCPPIGRPQTQTYKFVIVGGPYSSQADCEDCIPPVCCETTAQTACWSCETSGVETACSSCETSGTESGWHCDITETGCSPCETSSESGCNYCEGSCQFACEVACMVGCEVGCETGCEYACQGACEFACETGGCETSCELVCVTTCVTACELTLELCGAVCQTGCETGSQTCETGCETSCETGCETGGECYVTDQFNRANGGLGDNWSVVHALGSTTDSVTDNAARITWVSGTTAMTYCWWITPACADDHEVIFTRVYYQSGRFPLLLVRGDGDDTCYCLLVSWEASEVTYIEKVVDHVHTALGAGASMGSTKVGIRVSGSTLTSAYWDNALETWCLMEEIVNSDIASGTRFGFGSWLSAGESYTAIDDWGGGAVGDHMSTIENCF